MFRRRAGSIINLSSVVGRRGNAGQANYAAAKAGIIGLTKSLAKELGARGVRVNAIAPGYIDTPMTQALPEETAKAIVDNTPLRRIGETADVANAVRLPGVAEGALHHRVTAAGRRWSGYLRPVSERLDGEDDAARTRCDGSSRRDASSSRGWVSSRPRAATSTSSGAGSSPANRGSTRSRASTTARSASTSPPRSRIRPEDYVEKRTVRRLDLFSRYAVAAAKIARDDAGVRPSMEAETIGAVIGSGVGGLQTLHIEIEKLLEQGPGRATNPLLIPMMIPNMGAAQVSLELGTKGPLSPTCTACAAGSDAIGEAFAHDPPRRRRSHVRRRQRGADLGGRRGGFRRGARALDGATTTRGRLAAVRQRAATAS